MAGKIADTTFNVGPTNDVATVDVYKEQDSKPKGSKTETAAANVGSKAVEALKSGITLKDIAKITNIENGKASIDKSAATDKLKDVTGGLDSPVASLGDALADDLLVALGFGRGEAGAGTPGLPGDGNVAGKKLTSGDIRFVYDSVQNIRKTADLSSAQGVASLLNSISGNSQLAKILDMESTFAVLGKIMQKVSELGIPEAIDMILDKLADDKERRRLLLENLRAAVMASDLYTINKAIDYVGSAGVLTRVPDIVDLLFMFYRYPPGSSVATTALRDQLINTLARIDVHWYQYERNGVWISNLQPFTYASESALALMALSPTHLVPSRIAKSYYKTSLIDLARERHPNIALAPPDLTRRTL